MSSGLPAIAAQQASLVRESHAWGRFAPGAWRQVRIVTESFDADGKLTSTGNTDNITTVEDISPELVTLKIEATVEVAGQRFPSEPQIVRQGYAGESVGQNVAVMPLADQPFRIDGREIPCHFEQVEILGGQSKEVSRVHFSPRMTPRILRRETTVNDVASGKTLHESLSEVVGLDQPFAVLGATRRAYRVRLVQRNDRGTTTTQSVHVPEIPGEVVHQTSEKVDSAGRLERRSTLELVGYGLPSDDPPREQPGRRKQRRAKRGR